MMTSFAKTQSETLFELKNPSIASVLVALSCGSADGEGGPKARQWEWTLCHWEAVFPKERRKHSDWKSTTRPFLVESSVRGSRFDVVPPDAVR